MATMTNRTLLIAALALAAPSRAPAADIDFARDVRPILQKNCFRCHGERKQEGGLRLDVRRRALVGGDSGPGIVPGKPDGEVLKRVTARDKKARMPPDEPLSPDDVATLR